MTDFITGWYPGTGEGDWIFQPHHPGLWVDQAGNVVADEGGIAIDAIVDASTSLEFVNDLTTSVLISLFTDAPASDDDVIPDGTVNRRGWWGDPGMGSKIWLLERAKALPSVAATVESYAQSALAWLVSDGVAASVDASAVRLGPTVLQLTITILRGSGKPIAITFANLWDFL